MSEMTRPILTDVPAGKIHDLFDLLGEDGYELTIGRSPNADITLGEGELSEEDQEKLETVSKIHARLIHSPRFRKVFFRDQSQHGTILFRDGVRDAFADSERELQDGDELFFSYDEGYGSLVYNELDGDYAREIPPC
jgi:hypothetical protein